MKLLKKTGAQMACIAIVSMFIISGCGKSATPQERAQSAFDQLSDEMKDYTASINDTIGLEQLQDYMEANTVHSNIDLSMTFPDDEDVGNISITLDTISDIANKQFDMGVNVGAYGIGISLGNLIYSDEMFYVKSDKIFDSSIYSIDCTNFVEDFNNSEWASLFGTSMPETLVDTNDIKQTIDLSELIEDIKANASYSFLKDNKSFELDGKSTSCTGIEVIIDKDAAMQAVYEYLDALSKEMDDMLDYYGIDEVDGVIEALKDAEFEDDLSVDIYLDSKGRMVNISTPKDIEFTSGSSISFDIDFSGTDRRADVIDGKIYTKVGDSISCITIDRNAGVSDKEYSEDIAITFEDTKSNGSYTVKYINNWNKEDLSFDITFSLLNNDDDDELGFYADGYFTDIVKGEACTFKLNNAKFIEDNENVLIISLKILVEPTDKSVDVPSSSIDLLGMDEDEIMEMIYGAMIKISQIGVN